MKRMIIVCEGPTEVEFCKDVLYDYFLPRKILIQTPLIKKSGGGIVPWSTLKRQIENHLLQDNGASVTTLIDYYGIKDKHEFPGWHDSKTIPDKAARMESLEAAMKLAVQDGVRARFYPYLQLHEFEGLLFNDIHVFTNLIPEDEFIDKEELARLIHDFPNPELINDTPNNAPSARLQRLIKGYNKIVYGAILAREIGITKIVGKCPRFRQWINRLESM